MIVGGNIDGFTRTMTTAIALETSKGDLALAMGLGLVLLTIVLAVNASAICPRYVSLSDLSKGVPALAASYGAHALLTSLFPTKAGSGGSSLTNIRFDNVLKNHQQWFNLQWSKAENNPGWAIGYSKSAGANTSSACPGQVNFCSAAVAAASNKTVTTACQNVGTFVANAVLASRIHDLFSKWDPLSLSLNAPGSLTYNQNSSYLLTRNNNPTDDSSFLSAQTSGGDANTSLADGLNRSKLYSDEELNFAPYGSATAPGVKPYSLSPQLRGVAGWAVKPLSYLPLLTAIYTNGTNGGLPLASSKIVQPSE
jgi:hypothetical protein